MGKRFEMWIGGRYVRSRSSNNFVSMISAISMLGIAIAVTVLIVVMSVVNGFERELKDRLLAMTAHASIENVDGELASSVALIETAQKNPRVRAVAPYVDGQALLVFNDELSGAEIRGIDRAEEVGPTAHCVGVIDGRVRILIKMAARHHGQVPACREAGHADLL